MLLSSVLFMPPSHTLRTPREQSHPKHLAVNYFGDGLKGFSVSQIALMESCLEQEISSHEKAFPPEILLGNLGSLNTSKII